MGIPVEIEEPIWTFYKLSKITYRISWKNSQADGHGTGFVIVRLNGCLALATAKHVVQQVPNEKGLKLPVVWTATRYDERNNISRQFTFETTEVYFSSKSKGTINAHNHSDTAFIILPSLLADGSDFIPVDDDLPAPVAHSSIIFTPTTEIHWMGFPSMVEDPRVLGHPNLMYYHGYIGALIDNGKERSVYLVDGHLMSGVSGGPVWTGCSAGPYRYQIIGIVAQYGFGDIVRNQGEKDTLPGYCMFEPINYISKYMEEHIERCRLAKPAPAATTNE